MPAPALVLLAAGASRRYGRPKQLDPLGPAGETIMELTARDAVAAGVVRVVLVVNADTGDAVRERLVQAARRDGYAADVSIDAVKQQLDDLPARFAPPPNRTRPWGTAHALRTAGRELAGGGRPIVVANADDWYGPDAIARVVHAVATTTDPAFAALVPYPLDVTLPPPSTHDADGVSRGIVAADDAGRVIEIREVLGLQRDPEAPGVAHGRTAPRAAEAPHAGTAATADLHAGGEPDVTVSVDALCSMNLWGFGPAIWETLEHRFAEFFADQISEAGGEWFLPDVVLDAAVQGRLNLHALEPGTVHLGITHPTDRERVRAGLRSAYAASTRLPSRTDGD